MIESSQLSGLEAVNDFFCMRMCVIRFYCIEKPQSMIIFNHGKGKRQSLIYAEVSQTQQMD